MLMDFLSTVAAGGGAACVVYIFNHLTKHRYLPRWAMPAAIGLGMVCFAIWREYTWFDDVTAQLPPEVVVALAPEDQMFYRPWTYLRPLHLRFVAVDLTGAVRSVSDPSMLVASAVVIERWTATQRVPMAFDCAGFRRADLFEGATIGEGGTLVGADWLDVGADDPLVRAACSGG